MRMLRCLSLPAEEDPEEDRYLVYLVCLVCLVKQDQLDELHKLDEPDRPGKKGCVSGQPTATPAYASATSWNEPLIAYSTDNLLTASPTRQ